MNIGVDYYPEQWDKSLLQADADLMAKTGVKIVRVAEFAWSELEPQDGQFSFEWLDEVIRTFDKHGIEVILGVPTNCPPLWMYQAHPEIIQTDPDGRKKQLGIRGHRCINSPVFMTYAKRITEQMVRRYGTHKAVVAWQIDNELEAYTCCCDECRRQFRKWLLDRHDDLDTINAITGSVVWGNKYSDISQVDPPTAYPKAWQNPALCLEFYRFASESAAKFAKELAMVIHREVPRTKVTTNTWFCENTVDFYKLFEDMDITAYDNYPPLRIPADPDVMYSHAFELDLMRGIKDDKFWVMEQLSGITGSWAVMSPAPKPGMIMGYSLQAMAHGAETVLHFRWRTAAKGAEMFWHGLLDHSNVPGRRFYEFSELCKLADKISVISTTRIVSDIAIVYSPESAYAMQNQPQAEGMCYLDQLRFFHAAFSAYGANIDVVSPEADLSGYKIVAAPSLFVNTKESTENLYRYVINGGTLVLTNRSGVKDMYNNCIMDMLPTIFKELIGAEVAEYDPIGEEEHYITDFAGNQFLCRQWCDVMHLTTARAYAEYSDNYYRCCPAVTMNRYCSGVAYYVGTVCTMDFYENFAGNLMMQAGIPRLQGLPRGVEVTTRTNGLDEYIIFFNNSMHDAVIDLPKPMYSIISSMGRERLELRPFDVEIVRK